MSRFGVVPMTLPYEDVEVAMQTGELDGVCWSGITEDYTVGWADVTNYYLTNPISGAWAGSYFANIGPLERAARAPEDPVPAVDGQLALLSPALVLVGRGAVPHPGGKLELTTIPDEEWAQVEQAALEFWDEVAQQSDRSAKVVAILKEYAETMRAAGPPYRY